MIAEKKYRRYVEDFLSRANYFSSVILYDSYEDLAWYTALRMGELIADFIKVKFGKQISIRVNLILHDIMDNLNKMEDDDVLCISLDNQNIKSLKAHLVTEMLNEKKNLQFISQSDNSISDEFREIIDSIIKVNTLDQNQLSCTVNIHERGERELILSLPDKILINKYHQLRKLALKETIRKQVPELK